MMNVSATPIAIAPASPTAAGGSVAAGGMAVGGVAARPQMPPMARVVLVPLLGLLGYAAFLVTGYGAGLSAMQQPLPLYIYLSIVLLLFQIVILQRRAPATLVYVLLTSGFAVLYAADFTFFRRNNIFVGHGATYVVLNALLFLVFLYDAINRRLGRPQPLDPAASIGAGAGTIPAPTMPQQRLAPFSFGAFAVDFAALAVISYVAWFLLTIVVGLGVAQVDLSGLGLPAVATLGDLDRDIAVGATGAALALVVLASLLAVTAGDDAAAVRRFGRLNGRIVGAALADALLSLRLVLAPLLWLLPAFSIANFATNTADYLNASAHAPGNPFLNLFNPFSASSVAHYPMGIQSVLLFGLAVGAVILAVAVIEHNMTIFGRALRIAGVAGRALALLSALFFLSL
ncbi:MAG TPA: hypothetical protein VIG30_00005, partial [Ktedonobacterales bacterium]